MLKKIPTRKAVAALAITAAVTTGLMAGCAQQADQPETDVGQPQATQEPIDVAKAEELTGLSANDEGSVYKEGELMVIFWPENTVEDLEAVLAQAPSVQEKQITEDMIYDGTMEGGKLHRDTLEGPTLRVHSAEGATVVQAMAELERSDLVISTDEIELDVVDGWDTAGS